MDLACEVCWDFGCRGHSADEWRTYWGEAVRAVLVGLDGDYSFRSDFKFAEDERFARVVGWGSDPAKRAYVLPAIGTLLRESRVAAGRDASGTLAFSPWAVVMVLRRIYGEASPVIPAEAAGRLAAVLTVWDDWWQTSSGFVQRQDSGL